LLRRNPFNLLGATRRDNEARIVELANERALTLGQEVCQNARSELADLRSRLSAELSWLPDIPPDRGFSGPDKLAIEFCNTDPGLSPLTRANMLAAWIETVPAPVPESEIVRILLELAQAAEKIDPEVVMLDVNRDRLFANIPLVHDIRLVHVGLAARRQKFREVSRQLLNSVPTKALVRLLTELAARSTDKAQKRAPSLVEDIVADYETATQGFMERESYNVRKLAALVRLRIERGEREVSDLVETLCKVLRNWRFVIKPIQLINQSRGLIHSKSSRLGSQLESLAFELRNERLPLAVLSVVDCHLQEFGIQFQLPEGVPKTSTKVRENVSTEQQVIGDDAELRCDGAMMPKTPELPDRMKTPAQRQGIVVSPGRSDVERLNCALVSILEARRARDMTEERRSQEAADTKRASREELRKRKAARAAQRAAEAEQLTEADAGRRGGEEWRAREAVDMERAIRAEHEKPEAAERGDRAAQVDFGSVYQRGKDIKQDCAQGMTLYRRVAHEHSNIGLPYEHGSAVGKGKCSYSSPIGVVLKNRLEISASGLAWKGHFYKLEEVVGLRWGFWRPAIHLPIVRRYIIYIRTRSLGTVIRIGDADTYRAVVDRLWSTVGVRILSEHVKRLKEKDEIAFPGVLIRDDAVTLTYEKMFKIKEDRLAWDSVTVLSTDRYLTFMKDNDTILVSLSYTKIDNLRILEHLIGLMRTRGTLTISASLDLTDPRVDHFGAPPGAPPPILV
jgi:hypothetical protein